MLKKITHLIYKHIIIGWQGYINAKKVKNKTKIFIIGRNKTGTTSLHHEFLERGYIVGNQFQGSLLLDHYIKGDFDKIIDYTKTAQVFQDAPFSYPETYKHLHDAYPDAKFILSVRDSSEQWYNSVTRFHSKIFGNGRLPDKNDLKNAPNIYKGWIWKTNRHLYNTPEDDVYNKEILMRTYEQHNNEVRKYFKGSPNFLEINLSDPYAYKKFCTFLNLDLNGKNSFPWKNKTKDIQSK